LTIEFCQQILPRDRFADEPAGPQGQGHLFLGQDGADHDWNVFAGRVGVQAAEDFPAVDLRHHHVQQNQVGLGFLDGAYGLGWVVDGQELVARAAGQALHQPVVVGVVVDDQDMVMRTGRDVEDGTHAAALDVKGQRAAANFSQTQCHFLV